MTVIDSDAQIARKWLVWSIDRASIMNTDDVDRMAFEIAAAREAWGAPREAVNALVEAVLGRFPCADSSLPSCTHEDHLALRAALERVKG